LASMVVDSIESRLVPNIENINWKERNLLAVEVYTSSLRPHHIKVLGPEKGTFVRIVSTNRQADGPLRKELTRWAGDRSFDEEPMPEINPEAIDFRVASGLFSG
ncbi:MAG: AlbA family DNA-binding domain-containing protein, partial [Bacillota bacterium]